MSNPYELAPWVVGVIAVLVVLIRDLRKKS